MFGQEVLIDYYLKTFRGSWSY